MRTCTCWRRSSPRQASTTGIDKERCFGVKPRADELGGSVREDAGSRERGGRHGSGGACMDPLDAAEMAERWWREMAIASRW